jgi:hypothetical protein
MHTVSVKMAVTITFAFALLPLGPKLSACSDRHGTCRCKCWLRICSRVSGKTLASRVTFGPLNAVVTKFETVARWLRGTWDLSLGAFGKALDKFVQVLTSTVQEDRDCTRITLPCRELSEFRGYSQLQAQNEIWNKVIAPCEDSNALSRQRSRVRSDSTSWGRNDSGRAANTRKM